MIGFFSRLRQPRVIGDFLNELKRQFDRSPTKAELSRQVAQLEGAVEFARHERDQALAELAETRAALVIPANEAALWRRRYEEQVVANTRLDDRLARAEGRSTSDQLPDIIDWYQARQAVRGAAASTDVDVVVVTTNTYYTDTARAA